MLGKASEIKTCSLETYDNRTLGELINKWLSINSNVTVIDIKFGFSMTTSERAETALIIYKEEPTHEPSTN